MAIPRAFRISTLVKLILLICCFNSCTYAQSNSVNSIQIGKDAVAASTSCLHYKVEGVCFWLDCWGPFCSINKTLLVSHFLPDAVVSSFTQPSNNPWVYANTVVDPAALKAAQAQTHAILGFQFGDGHNFENKKTLARRSYETDVIGDPALTLFSVFPYLLPSAATPYVPYYASLADSYAWRNPLLELFYPGSLIPGLHEVGAFPYNDWGNVYPREGFIKQPDSYKAAAVMAQRAGSIATGVANPHIHNPLPLVCGNHCHADPVVENNGSQTEWQLISPQSETQCRVFGSGEPQLSKPLAKNYSWLLWRHYEGCLPNDGLYLGQIKF